VVQSDVSAPGASRSSRSVGLPNKGLELTRSAMARQRGPRSSTQCYAGSTGERNSESMVAMPGRMSHPGIPSAAASRMGEGLVVLLCLPPVVGALAVLFALLGVPAPSFVGALLLDTPMLAWGGSLTVALAAIALVLTPGRKAVKWVAVVAGAIASVALILLFGAGLLELP
jgi:hypothetical protein